MACGEQGEGAPRTVNEYSTWRVLQPPGVLPGMHISQLGLATNTSRQIDDSLGSDVHLTFPALKGKASLSHLLSTKFRMDEMIPQKQRLLL